MTPDDKIAELRTAHEVFAKKLSDAHQEYADRLADLCPESADTLTEHHRRFCGKQERLARLELFLAQHSDLPFAGMYGECDASLGAYDEAAPEVAPLGPDADYRQRGADTKRRRTREALIAATVELVLAGERFNLRKVAARAKVGFATFHDHFGTKGALLAVVYERLINMQ